MKARFIVVTIGFISLSIMLKAQNAYYDALMFSDLKLNQRHFRLSDGAGQILSDTVIIKDFFANPFNAAISARLNDYLPKLRTEHKRWVGRVNASGKLNGLFGLGFSITESSQSMIIDAVAQIVVEDFQNGVNTVFINKIKDKLDKIPELQAFFPDTYQFFQDTNPFDYAKLGKDFKAKFEADLKALVRNVSDYIAKSPIKPWTTFQASKFYKPYCLASDIGDKLINGSHPTELLDFLEQKYAGNTSFDPYYKVIRVVNIIQSNFQKAENVMPGSPKQFENIWLQYKDLKKLNAEQISFLMALIYQQDPTLFASLITDTTPAGLGNFYKTTVLPALDLLMTIDNICQKKNMTGDDLGQMLSLLIDLMDGINKAYPFLSVNDFTTYKSIAGKIGEIYTSVAKKDYNSIITNVAYIINEMDKEINSGNQTANVLKVTSALVTYGSFFTDVVNAKTTDELKTAYRKATVSRGSFLDKRLSLSSLTISAHPGIIGGIEQLSGTNDWKANVGITAPIGFEFTSGLRKKANNGTANFAAKTSVKALSGSSWGVMLAFADIGAVFNYRFKDSESELPQKLTFKQVFSPGVALHYGFKNSPIVLGAGVQYTPELRTVTASSVTTQANSFRSFIRLTWDLPLVKFYYKKSK